MLSLLLMSPSLAGAPPGGATDRDETVFAELSGGAMGTRDDAYTDRMADFGFSDRAFLPLVGVWSVGAGWSPTRHLAIVAAGGKLDHRKTWRDHVIGSTGSGVDEFDWITHAVEVGPRAQLPLPDDHVVLFAQIAAGLALSASRYASPEGETEERHRGPELSLAAGVREMPSRSFGLFQQLRWATAPALRNLLGDVHDSGGWSVSIGVRAAL